LKKDEKKGNSLVIKATSRKSRYSSYVRIKRRHSEMAEGLDMHNSAEKMKGGSDEGGWVTQSDNRKKKTVPHHKIHSSGSEGVSPQT